MNFAALDSNQPHSAKYATPLRRVRLVVRTPPSHGGNTGSTPVRGAIFLLRVYKTKTQSKPLTNNQTPAPPTHPRSGIKKHRSNTATTRKLTEKCSNTTIQKPCIIKCETKQGKNSFTSRT
jgi:hypothetical protein